MHTAFGHVENSGTHHHLRWGKKAAITHITSNTTLLLEKVGMRYSLAVTFHVFPVAKGRVNMAVISKNHQ